MELAGVVTEVGGGVKDLKAGDRVMALIGVGAYAEEVIAPADRVYRVPDAMDYPSAAGFPVAYGTSHGAFDWRAHLQPGEWALVLGAAGGVGLTAVDVAKAMGAKGIAPARSPGKPRLAKHHGPVHLVDYSREDVGKQVKRLTGRRDPA